jgi:hypothetical protein
VVWSSGQSVKQKNIERAHDEGYIFAAVNFQLGLRIANKRL